MVLVPGSRFHLLLYRRDHAETLLEQLINADDIKHLSIQLSYGIEYRVGLSRARFQCIQDLNQVLHTICNANVTVVKLDHMMIDPVLLQWILSPSNINAIWFDNCGCIYQSIVEYEKFLVDTMEFNQVGAIGIEGKANDVKSAEVDALVRILMHCVPIHFTCQGYHIDMAKVFSTPLLLRNVRELVLSHAGIDDASLETLVRILDDAGIMTCLELLSLRSNKLTDISPIFPIIGTGCLDTLDVSFNKKIVLPDDSSFAESIEKSDYIYVIDLSGIRTIQDNDLTPLFRWPILTHPTFAEFICDYPSRKVFQLKQFITYYQKDPLHCAVGLIMATRTGKRYLPIDICRVICAWLWNEHSPLF